MPFHESQDVLPERAVDAPSRSTVRSVASLLVTILLIYFAVAYLLMPRLWKRYEARHPALENAPRVTHTKSNIPGDPVNIALIGDEEALQRGMLAAGWFPADELTLESSLRIAAATVLRRPYEEAPVSPLFLFGREQDLAFEQPVGNDPRKRHHVRFWRSDRVDAGGRPLWFGAATYDDRVGVSKTTGQITHHVSPYIDADRDLIVSNLGAAGMLIRTEYIAAFQPLLKGRNGGGDPWETDGRLAVGWLKP